MDSPMVNVIVVGSGAAGGWAAKELCEAGCKVQLLEAGPLFAADLRLAVKDDLKRQAIQSKCRAFNQFTRSYFVDDVDNPYSTPEDKPFVWIRGRQMGGRMHLWGRACLRFSDKDFKAASLDGEGMDWPIAYSDLSPFYERVEKFTEIEGNPDGLAHVPDGVCIRARPLSTREQGFKKAVEQSWNDRRVISARLAVGPIEATLLSALATGNLELRPNTVAKSLTFKGGSKLATGIRCVDSTTGQEQQLEADAVVLCGSTIETIRLLLNSASSQHPEGVGNSSGHLGTFLMDHLGGISVSGIVGPKTETEESSRAGHVPLLLIPRFKNLGGQPANFKRGYQAHVYLTQRVPIFDLELQDLVAQGQEVFRMVTCGEVLPRQESRVRIDREKVDRWGVPVPHIEVAYAENEQRMAADMSQELPAMARAAGLEILNVSSNVARVGSSIHELGGARMGPSPDVSVVNRNNQVWDSPNVVVADGACFTSGGCQNPTLTIMALAARAGKLLADRVKRGAAHHLD